MTPQNPRDHPTPPHPSANASQPNAAHSQNVTEHLANERTYLAWLRTGLALLGFGMVLARLGWFLQQLAAVQVAHPARTPRSAHEFAYAGVVLIALGTLVFLWAGIHYQRTRRAIQLERFAPANRAVVLISVVATLIGFVILAMVLRGLIEFGLEHSPIPNQAPPG